jgi:amino acid transporter
MGRSVRMLSQMSLTDILFGKPLPSWEERATRIGPLAGVPVFGLDAISSAAYGPEAALTVMLATGWLAPQYLLPISAVIVVLLAIVYFSYRQTIDAYPSGGGSYTVAHENLGALPGLLAAAALIVDYTLTAGVGISAGVGALISAVPRLQVHTLGLCLGILVVITVVNLRGVRDTGVAFMIPTYLFVACLGGAIVTGMLRPAPPVLPLPALQPPRIPATPWLLLQAFASGCTAMTGVEAVSNGVQAFREPVSQTAKRTLTLIVGILALLLLGIGHLVRQYHIGATTPGGPGYQSVLSQLTEAVAGRGAFYNLTIGSILVVLALSANTAFADFPRLCRVLALDSYLPYGFASRGRRLVYSQGILVLATLTAILLTVFGGVTDRLIPLFAIGAFLAFTLSQAGMVMHWKRTGGRRARTSMLINAIGATATAATTLVVAVAKFAEGAWITVLVIPCIIVLLISIRRHYHRVALATRDTTPLDPHVPPAPIVIVPIARWGRISKKALRFALRLSGDVRALQIQGTGDEQDLRGKWAELVERPAQQAGFPPPQLVTIPSPYRFLITPILNYIFEVEKNNPDRHIAVLVPELVERGWYYYFLHNQRAEWMKAQLLLRGNRRIIVINVPWYLDDQA